MNSCAQPSITLDDTPAIYAANLHAYNCGNLVGEWIAIEPGMDGDDIRGRIQAMLDRTGGEEYAIHDYNNLPSSLGEWPDLDTVAEIAHAISEHGYELIKGFVDYFDADQLGDFDDRYVGTYTNEEDFACEILSEQYNLDKMLGSLASYFDYEAYARDLFMGDFVSVDLRGEIAVFRNY